MNKCKFLILVTLVFTAFLSSAQEKSEIRWKDPSKEGSPVVHNQLWNGNMLKSFYDRLPSVAEANTRKEVWGLSRNAAGLKLVFRTDAEEIFVRYTTTKTKANYAMDHFPATGVSGVDLFAENSDGSWAWANGRYQFNDTITYSFSGLNLDKEKYKDGRKFHLYLPLYNNIKWLEIGVRVGNSIEFIPVSVEEKPIVVYGTSIAQGGCASRPGMAWTNILNRTLKTPVVNLGFSGNGRLEREVVDLFAEKDAQMFILDCLPNLGGEVQNVKSKTIDAVNTIRGKHSNVPIILVDQAHYIEGKLNSAGIANTLNINRLSYEAYEELKSKGIKHLYYLKHRDIGLDMNDSVDGSHPTDMGMLKYAKAYEKLINEILKK